MQLSSQENFYLSQLRPHGIPLSVAKWMMSVPHEVCMPDGLQAFAYADQGFPLGRGRHHLRPFEVAFLLKALYPKSNESVLEVGHSAGYLTALLAKKCCSVLCVEPSAEQVEQIERGVLGPLRIKNAHLSVGDAYLGWGDETYSIILLNGAVPYVSDALKDQLAIGGRLFAVVGSGPIMQATLFTRASQSHITEQVLFDTHISAYPAHPSHSAFVF